MSAIERQTIDILARLNDNNKLFVLDFIKFIEQKQLSEKANVSKRTDLLSQISIDTRGWRFDKEEANER